MRLEDQFHERLLRVEAQFFGATTEGEREAAGAAAERLKAKLDEAKRRDAPVALKFVMPGSMVGQAVHRAMPAQWLQSLPRCAPAPHDGHGQGAAPAFQRSGGDRVANCTTIYGRISMRRRSG
jgi:hypothetical protein